MYDLKAIIEAHTVEGVVDYEKVMGDIDNGYVNPIVAKKTDKSKLIPEVTAQLIKELGVEGESIDDLKLYVKKMGGSTDEIKEANLELEKRYKELETNHKETVGKLTQLETKQQELHREQLIRGLGVQDEKQIEFLKWDLNRKVTEEKDFDTVVAEYAKENNVKTTTKFVKDPYGVSNETDIAEVWREKRKLRRK